MKEGIALLQKITPAEQTEGFNLNDWESACYKAMNDDFNSPLLIAKLFDATKFINSVHQQKASISQNDLIALQTKLHGFVEDVLGLKLEDNDSEKASDDTLSGTVNILIELRNKARENKDFATSDRIRDKLLALGIQLKDGKEGTSYTHI